MSKVSLLSIFAGFMLAVSSVSSFAEQDYAPELELDLDLTAGYELASFDEDDLNLFLEQEEAMIQSPEFGQDLFRVPEVISTNPEA